MENQLRDKIKNLVIEELNTIMNETQAGSLLNKDFDPVDPEVHIAGYGVMLRSQLRTEITNRITALAKTAKLAETDETPYDSYKTMMGIIGDKGILMRFIQAELAVADELEAMRTKGGRRAIPIPKQK